MDSIKIKRTAIFSGMFSDRKRVITIAHTDNKMGISICNPKDKHIKKIGTELAIKRLMETPMEVPQDLSRLNYEEIVVIGLTIVKSKMLVSIKGGVV